MKPFTTETSQHLIRDAVAEFSSATGFPIAFGGFESAGVMQVTAQFGAYGDKLLRLRVAHERGLGGRAMVEHRPRFTRDYLRSQHISHDYDTEIGSEGIVMLVAVPVVVDGLTRAVLYGGTRGSSSPDESFLRAAAAVSSELASGIREADHALREQTIRLDTPLSPTGDRTDTLHDPLGSAGARWGIDLADSAPVGLTEATGPERDGRVHDGRALDGRALEELRQSHAELRQIGSEITDPVLRERLAAVEQRLAQIGKPTLPIAHVQLTPRETDVLTHAALGATNAGIGGVLGLTESTVKSYLKTAMAKLDAQTRHAAVTAARGQGLIP